MRPLNGIVSIFFWSTVRLSSALRVSSIGAAPTTVVASSSDATFNVKSIAGLLLAVKTSPARSSPPKPGSSTLTLYSPTTGSAKKL